MKKAVYAGTFDPITDGHLWIIDQASKLFDEVIVAIGVNPAKKTLFTEDERLAMVTKVIELDEWENVKVDVIKNQLLIDYARDNNAKHIVRGLRNANDFTYEVGLNLINERINNQATSGCTFVLSNVETVYLIPPSDLVGVSSSVVKGLVGFKNWTDIVEGYVPGEVLDRLKEKEQ